MPVPLSQAAWQIVVYFSSSPKWLLVSGMVFPPSFIGFATLPEEFAGASQVHAASTEACKFFRVSQYASGLESQLWEDPFVVT